MITMRNLRRKKKEEPEEIKPIGIEGEPPITVQPKGNGRDSFSPVETPEAVRNVFEGASVQVDLNELMKFIADPEGEHKHIFTDVAPHHVIDLVRMDIVRWMRDTADTRSLELVIIDSYCKWRRPVNREGIKDIHRLFAHYPVKEHDEDRGIIQ